jgi:hypothetical protein
MLKRYWWLLLLVLLSVFCVSAEHLTAIVHLHPQNQSHLTHLTTIHPHLIIQVTEPPIKTPIANEPNSINSKPPIPSKNGKKPSIIAKMANARGVGVN